MVKLRFHSRNHWQAQKLGDSGSFATLSLKLKDKAVIACSSLGNHVKNAIPPSFEHSPLFLLKSVNSLRILGGSVS